MKQAISNRLQHLLPSGGFARNVSLLVGGTALAQAVAVAAAPVLTRIYKPADFGTLQIFISLMAVIIVAAAGRYEIALLLPEDEDKALDVLAAAIACVVGSSLLCAGFVAVCHFHWLLPNGMRPISKYLWLLPLSVLGGGIYQTLSYWAMRSNRYRQLATTKFTQVGAQLLTQIGIGSLVHSPLGLVLGDAAGRVTGSGRFLTDIFRERSAQLRAITFAKVRAAAVRYREYPLVSLWGALVNASGSALPPLLLADFYGVRGAGLYALVNRVLGVPTTLLGTSISQVYSSRAATLSRENPEELMRLFKKTISRMAIAGAAPCAIFILISPWAFQVIFGHEWKEAGYYARLLAVLFYAGFISSPVTMTLVVLERPRAQFAWDISSLALSVAAMVVPHALGYKARTALGTYGFAMAFLYVVHIAQSYLAIRHRIRAAAIESHKLGIASS